MKKDKRKIFPSVVISLLWVLELVFVYEIYTWYIAIVDRGYHPTEITYFAISFGWLPIALICIALSVFIAGVIVYAVKRRNISIKAEALTLVLGLVVCVFYALPVTTLDWGISFTQYRAMAIASCVLYAVYLLCRGIVFIVKQYKNAVKLKTQN